MEVATSDCISCLGDENLFNIFDTHECQGKEEVYVVMLKSCFDITIQEESGINGMCEKCILKLREAYYLKNNIINSVKVLSNRVTTEIDMSFPSMDDAQSSNDGYYDEDDLEIQLDPETGDMFYIVVQNDGSNKTENDTRLHNKQGETNFEKVKENHIGNLEKQDGGSKQQRKTRSNEVKGEIDENISEKNATSHVCEKCGKTFLSPRHVSKHMLTHADGPHVCQYCGMVFSKLNTKNAHVWRVHNTKEPYVCGKCGQRFTTFHKRLNHLLHIHGVTAEYPCPYCEKTFPYSAPRSKHVRSVHLNIRNHKCTECNMAFFKRRALYGHMATKHGIGEKPNKCPICSKSFFRTNTLKFHMKRHEEKKRKAKQLEVEYNYNHTGVMVIL
ncbi:zinc finger protein with KRAB and SCAN domains 1-like [Pectinophora gossypiella]|uniref:zinc finger protein with KRAB and SCAN domains 1-like n=1 Tax=Pectinophora gossypiella TaxID=13191 RepID=UPI00214E7A73|nr:zinc finger protein with KRAB and SCAN domains 1-like [Pectinophora gossypiella]